MAFKLERTKFPGIAASPINDGDVVVPAGSANERRFLKVATVNVEPFGLAGATAASQGVAFDIFDEGNYHVVKAIASLGAGADIGVASTNGGLAPVAGASGVVVHRVGKSLGPAAAGEYFTLQIKPRQLSGAA